MWGRGGPEALKICVLGKQPGANRGVSHQLSGRTVFNRCFLFATSCLLNVHSSYAQLDASKVIDVLVSVGFIDYSESTKIGVITSYEQNEVLIRYLDSRKKCIAKYLENNQKLADPSGVYSIDSSIYNSEKFYPIGCNKGNRFINGRSVQIGDSKLQRALEKRNGQIAKRIVKNNNDGAGEKFVLIVHSLYMMKVNETASLLYCESGYYHRQHSGDFFLMWLLSCKLPLIRCASS